MIKTIVTDSGFACEVDTQAMDNLEFLEAMMEAAEGDVLSYSRGAVMLLGAQGKKRLHDHIRTEDGRVPIKRFGDELLDILGKMGQSGKN